LRTFAMVERLALEDAAARYLNDRRGRRAGTTR